MSEAQTRILTHMNKSHKLAIEDYLNVYGEVIINDKITNIKMKSIELDHFEISFNHLDIEFEIVKPVPIDPPMKSFKDLRDVLVEMAKYLAKKRGFSHVQIEDMVYPSSFPEYLLLFLVSLVVFGSFYPKVVFDRFLFYILPSSIYWLALKANKFIAIATIIIHALELKFILLPKLNYYRVPTDFKIEWVFFGLLEGFPCIKRFNKLVSDTLDGRKH